MELSTDSYWKVLKSIEGSQLAAASKLLREFRHQSGSDGRYIFLRSLLSARIAMKDGNFDLQPNQFDPEAAPTTELRAEALMIKAMLENNRGNYDASAENFLAAAKSYSQCQREDRELLALFNHQITRMGSQITLEEQLDELRSIEKRALAGNHKRVLNLIRRHKSFLYYDHGKFRPALSEVRKTIQYFELNGPKSDYHIALLHAADCCIDLGRAEAAKTYLEYILGDLEARVRFPFHYVNAKLEGKKIEFEKFPLVTEYWKKRALRGMQMIHSSVEQPSMIWRRSKNQLEFLDGKKAILKPASLEGKLIEMLSHSRSSKQLISERLWPEHSELFVLDNRLHRLVSRVNKKFCGIIGFDGFYYSLAQRLQIRD